MMARPSRPAVAQAKSVISDTVISETPATSCTSTACTPQASARLRAVASLGVMPMIGARGTLARHAQGRVAGAGIGDGRGDVQQVGHVAHGQADGVRDLGARRAAGPPSMLSA
jgi:hypothetical protein